MDINQQVADDAGGKGQSEKAADSLFTGVLYGDLLSFLDEAAIRQMLIDRYHLQSTCPICSGSMSEKNWTSFCEGLRTSCDAGHQFNWRAGTPLHQTRITPQQLVLMIILIDAGTTPQQVADRVGVTTETIRLWKIRLVDGGIK